MKIFLSQTTATPYVAEIDELDADLNEFAWTAYTKHNRYFHAFRREGNRTIWLHRVIAERIVQRPLERDELVVFSDGDGLNYHRANLLIVNRTYVKQHNRLYKNNTSGYRGVHWSKHAERWQARIMVNKVYHHLGYFDTPEDAYVAYCEAKDDLYSK